MRSSLTLSGVNLIFYLSETNIRLLLVEYGRLLCLFWFQLNEKKKKNVRALFHLTAHGVKERPRIDNA